MQAVYSDQYRDLDDGYGLKYETAAEHPHLFIPFAPWRGARDHFALMEAMSSTVPIGVLLHRHGVARAVHGRCRRRRLWRRAVHPELVSHHGLRSDGRLADDVRVRPDGPDLGGPRPLRARRVELPTASGVNPQISIQAIAHMGARGLAARLI